MEQNKRGIKDTTLPVAEQKTPEGGKIGSAEALGAEKPRKLIIRPVAAGQRSSAERNRIDPLLAHSTQARTPSDSSKHTSEATQKPLVIRSVLPAVPKARHEISEEVPAKPVKPTAKKVQREIPEEVPEKPVKPTAKKVQREISEEVPAKPVKPTAKKVQREISEEVSAKPVKPTAKKVQREISEEVPAKPVKPTAKKVQREIPEEVPAKPVKPMAKDSQQKNAEEPQKKPKKRKSDLFYSATGLLLKIGWIALSLLVILLFVVGVYTNSGVNMEPSFHDRDIVFYNRLSSSYEAGDVVVFRKNDRTQMGRIVAVSGDMVGITEGGLQLNGYYQTELYTKGETVQFESGVTFPLTLGKDEYFILFDNRTQGGDSRTMGKISSDEIKGHVILSIRARDF